jgi:hypothetical protein
MTSFVVPGKDFRVVYYDKFTRTTIAQVLQPQAVNYLFDANNDPLWRATIESSLRKKETVFYVKTQNKDYCWFPTSDKDNLNFCGGRTPLSDILKDHISAVTTICNNLNTTTQQPPKDLTVVYKDSQTCVYHARVYKEYQILACPTWYADAYSWDAAMVALDNELFVVHHIGPWTFHRYLYIRGPGQRWSQFDVNGLMGTTLPTIVTNAVDEFVNQGKHRG